MKLEAVTPFLGKYRPFVGRCCQTCTPKSWVSDDRARPHLGKPGLAWFWESTALESSFLMSPKLPSSVFGQNGCASILVVHWPGAGSWLPGLRELGGEVPESREEVEHGRRAGV